MSTENLPPEPDSRPFISKPQDLSKAMASRTMDRMAKDMNIRPKDGGPDASNLQMPDMVDILKCQAMMLDTAFYHVLEASDRRYDVYQSYHVALKMQDLCRKTIMTAEALGNKSDTPATPTTSS